MRFDQISGSRWGRCRTRRAVSDVVATLLLVAVVVSLGVIAFTFASTGLGSLTQSFTGLISNQGNAVAERFVVEQVTFNFPATSGADVYVRNVGTIASTLVSVYVVDQSTNAFVTQVALSSSNVVNVGTVLDIVHSTVTFTPSHGHTYSFTVTSNLGNSVTFNARAT